MVGNPSPLAKALAVPRGITAKGMPVPMRTLATSETVPSPPEAIINSVPCATASRVSCSAAASKEVR